MALLFMRFFFLKLLRNSIFFFYSEVNLEQAEMQNFTTKIVDMMKSEGLFEWQGGPIILSQVCLQVATHIL
jgi:hypothetical protein